MAKIPRTRFLHLLFYSAATGWLPAKGAATVIWYDISQVREIVKGIQSYNKRWTSYSHLYVSLLITKRRNVTARELERQCCEQLYCRRGWKQWQHSGFTTVTNIWQLTANNALSQ